MCEDQVGTVEKRRAGSGQIKRGCAEGGEGCHQAEPHPRGDGRFSPWPRGGEEVSALTSGPGKMTAVSGRSPGSAGLEAASGPRGVLGAGPGTRAVATETSCRHLRFSERPLQS